MTNYTGIKCTFVYFGKLIGFIPRSMIFFYEIISTTSKILAGKESERRTEERGGEKGEGWGGLFVVMLHSCCIDFSDGTSVSFSLGMGVFSKFQHISGFILTKPDRWYFPVDVLYMLNTLWKFWKLTNYTKNQLYASFILVDYGVVAKLLTKLRDNFIWLISNLFSLWIIIWLEVKGHLLNSKNIRDRISSRIFLCVLCWRLAFNTQLCGCFAIKMTSTIRFRAQPLNKYQLTAHQACVFVWLVFCGICGLHESVNELFLSAVGLLG